MTSYCTVQLNLGPSQESAKCFTREELLKECYSDFSLALIHSGHILLVLITKAVISVETYYGQIEVSLKI